MAVEKKVPGRFYVSGSSNVAPPPVHQQPKQILPRAIDIDPGRPPHAILYVVPPTQLG